MFQHVLTAVLAATALTGRVVAQKASLGNNCPADSPCCGLYMDCGVGAFCVQGCDPMYSNSLEACVPNPQCKSQTYELNNLDDVISIDRYLGDVDKANWVSQGKPNPYNGQGVMLTMAQGTVGTLLSSTHYVWYGKVCAKIKTSGGQGVVTAFILMSDAKDEIDFEWVGNDVNTAQTNFYHQGITNYDNGDKSTMKASSFDESHEYCIDWSEDELKWLIDNDEVRSLQRSTTWNASSNVYSYPQTPARIMLSLWPAGLPTNGQGTVEWAGGEIQWDSQYMDNGFYYAIVDEVTVECYDPPSGVQGSGSKSYLYTDRVATNNTVSLSDKLVILSGLDATGENPGTQTSSSGSKPTRTANSVPGGNPGGGLGRGQDLSANSDSGSSDGNGNSVPGGDVGGPAAQPTGAQQFVQGGGSEGAAVGLQVSGSALAIVIAIIAVSVL